jgi:DNA-binding transcriptional ArsR family regulator
LGEGVAAISKSRFPAREKDFAATSCILQDDYLAFSYNLSYTQIAILEMDDGVGLSVGVLRYPQHVSSILEAYFQDGGGTMPFWSKNRTEFLEMDRLIRQQPGIRPAEIAEQLGVARSTITRRLPSLEEAGFLYSEDKRGGLWPFRREK